MNSEPEISMGAGKIDEPSSTVTVDLTERDLDALREAVRTYYTEKRYGHALCVEEEAARLGEIFLPGRIHALRAAALLHDITKKFDLEKQLKCCADFGIIIPLIIHFIHLPQKFLSKQLLCWIINISISYVNRFLLQEHPHSIFPKPLLIICSLCYLCSPSLPASS